MRALLIGLVAAVALATPASATSATPLADEHKVALSPDQAAEVPRVAEVVTYRAAARGAVDTDLVRFRDVVADTLDDPRGWSLGGVVRFTPVSSDAELRIWLASPAEVAAAHPACDATFSCRVGPDVYINVERWRSGATGEWKLPLTAYRRYVVNHEVGHWVGLDHQPCTGAGDAAPVMLQQTIGLDGCDPRVWPLPRELRRAAAYLGVSSP